MSSMAFKAAVAAVEDHLDEPTEVWSTGQRFDQLDRIEQLQRLLPALAHDLINQLAATASVDELGGRLSHALADRLRIPRAEAARRVEEAVDLGPRQALTGEPLSPRLEHTAAAQGAGLIGAGHVKVIRDFLAQLPCWVDEPARDKAEHDLADAATRFRPDEVKQLADHIDLCLNPDGNFSDEHRARQRGITIGRQGRDGMSRISGYLTPKPAPGGTRWPPSGRRRAYATPPTKSRRSAVRHPRKPSAMTCAPPRNAIMTH